LAIKKGVDCKSCHADLIRGNGDVPRERCLSCHNREGDLEHIQDHVFMHTKHVTEHKVDCIQCHSPILHTLDPKKLEHAASDCQSCHPNHHQEQVHLLQGMGSKLLAEIGAKAGAAESNLMVDVRVECRTCHTIRETSSTGTELVRGSKAMCSMCHDAATVKQFEAYHISLRGALPVLQATMAKVEAAVRLPGDHPEKLLAEIGNVRHDLDLLTRGNDIHNMHYATKVVREVTERLAAICLQLKIEKPDVKLLPPVQEKPTSTHVDAAKTAPAKKP
jgi:hypothetical protein